MAFLLVLSPETAAAINGYEKDGEIVEPRLIEAGEHAGKYALSPSVMVNPAFAELAPHFAAAMATMKMANIDPSEAWPEA